MGVITHWLEADELPRCQHCPNLADERSFMCEDCSGQADEERDDLAEQLRGAVEEIEKTAREHCHCAAEPGPCSVCRARGYLIARDAGGQ